jgi:tRNA 2-thiouridine synthesizing protein A
MNNCYWHRTCKIVFVFLKEMIDIETKGGINMAVEVLDTVGLKCPQPVLKIAVKAADMKIGDILEILGDCPTFERDVRVWCERLNKILLSIKNEGGYQKRIQIQF